MSRKYFPSNGTEGMWFVDEYCGHCIHEKFMHTNDHADKQCPIFNRSLIEGSPINEWIYDENNKPTCTEFKKFDWNRDDDGNFIDPPPAPTNDPNQLTMPFIFDELGIGVMVAEYDNSVRATIVK